MSGPVERTDAPPEASAGSARPGTVEVTPARAAEVAGFGVRRALPIRSRRTVGAWCFLDHLGPGFVSGAGGGLQVGPHPHIGLQTVTWLVAGEIVHRDSLGSEQVIRPGQLNLMTAGRGVAHSEEPTGYVGEVHGVQLWVAQPSATREGDPAFEHHADLPVVDVPGGTATVLVGDFAGVASDARRDTAHVGVDLACTGNVEVPLVSAYEHALVVLTGRVAVDGVVVEPGALAYIGTGREELRVDVDAPARVLLVGGEPFPEPVLMWWNYVAREQDEITAAHDSWVADDGRFGRVESELDRIVVGPPPWRR